MIGGHSKILLVEDSDADATAIERLLRQIESDTFEVRRVITLSSALIVLAEDEPCDVILLDLSLPDSHHTVSAKSILARVTDIPVIVLTGNSDESVAIESMQQGVMDYLLKDDLNHQLLHRSIRYAIERMRVMGKLRSANRELETINSELEQRVEDRTRQIREMEKVTRQQQQQLAHADRLNLLGELATGLAHELNQPLMAITAFSRSAQQRLPQIQKGTREVSELLEEISSEANRAGEIIRRLRQMIRRSEPRKSKQNLHALIHDISQLVQPEMKAEQIELNLPQPTGDITIMADAVQFQQVVINLIQNAFRAVCGLPGEDRRIEVVVEDGETSVSVCVRNSVLEPVGSTENWFDPFFTTSPGGIGLGLPICRRIMKSLGGELKAHISGQIVTMMMSLPKVSSG